MPFQRLVNPEDNGHAASSFRRRQWLTLGVLACVNLCQGVTFSCIVPFFPGQAKAKGLSTAQIGFLIGIYQLGLAICSPLLGQWMAPLGPSRLFSAGLCLCAAAVASFGGLPLLQTGPAFFWAAFSLRALMAAGFAAYKTSQMAILAQTVPERLASAVGVLEVFSALSYSLGPVLGSALIQFGGFHLPFAVFGLLMFLAGLTSIWLLCDKETTPNAAVVGMPIEQQSPTTSVDEVEEKSGLRLVASVPELWLTSLGLGSQMLCTFFYDASLAEHIIRVDRSPMLAGTLISITAITCTCTSPLWGFLVDRSGRRGFAEFLLLGGAMGAALFALLIGPSPLIGFFQLSLPLLAVAFALQGMSLTAMGTPSLKHCLRAAKDRGLDPESAAICGSISGILQGSISLGAFLGNSLGGISVQQIGFEWTGTLAAAFQLPFILGFAGFKARNFVWKFIKQQKTAVAELSTEEEL